MLRDRLVCGIKDIKLQERLLAERGLTFAKAFELAQAAELAEKNAMDIQHSTTASVCTVQPPDSSACMNNMHDTCFRCGGRHCATDCRFKLVECYNCGKLGLCLVYVVAKSLDALLGRTPFNGDPRIPIRCSR